MTHNGVDIDQFLLLAIYPTVAFFAVGYLGKRALLVRFLQVRPTIFNKLCVFHWILHSGSKRKCAGYCNSSYAIWHTSSRDR